MRTVHELNPNELEELRESYFFRLQNWEPESLLDREEAGEIPMSEVIKNHEGVLFSEDDFFCNL